MKSPVPIGCSCQSFAGAGNPPEQIDPASNNPELRKSVVARLKPWMRPFLITVIVQDDGTVQLWGVVNSRTEKTNRGGR